MAGRHGTRLHAATRPEEDMQFLRRFAGDIRPHPLGTVAHERGSDSSNPLGWRRQSGLRCSRRSRRRLRTEIVVLLRLAGLTWADSRGQLASGPRSSPPRRWRIAADLRRLPAPTAAGLRAESKAGSAASPAGARPGDAGRDITSSWTSCAPPRGAAERHLECGGRSGSSTQVRLKARTCECREQAADQGRG